MPETATTNSNESELREKITKNAFWRIRNVITRAPFVLPKLFCVSVSFDRHSCGLHRLYCVQQGCTNSFASFHKQKQTQWTNQKKVTHIVSEICVFFILDHIPVVMINQNSFVIWTETVQQLNEKCFKHTSRTFWYTKYTNEFNQQIMG